MAECLYYRMHETMMMMMMMNDDDRDCSGDEACEHVLTLQPQHQRRRPIKRTRTYDRYRQRYNRPTDRPSVACVSTEVGYREACGLRFHRYYRKSSNNKPWYTIEPARSSRFYDPVVMTMTSHLPPATIVLTSSGRLYSLCSFFSVNCYNVDDDDTICRLSGVARNLS